MLIFRSSSLNLLFDLLEILAFLFASNVILDLMNLFDGSVISIMFYLDFY